MTRLSHLFCTLVICLVIFATPLLHAQSNGSLHGQVTDPSGAIVPGASVAVTAATPLERCLQEVTHWT
jgi:hypothetical protein